MIIAVAATVMFLFALWAFLKQCAGWLSRFGSAWPPATGRSKSIRFKIAPLTSRILCVLLRCRVWHSLVFVCISPGGESGLALVAASVMIDAIDLVLWCISSHWFWHKPQGLLLLARITHSAAIRLCQLSGNYYRPQCWRENF